MSKKYLTAKQAADYAHVKVPSIYQSLRTGRVRYTKKDGRLYIERVSFEHYLATKFSRDYKTHNGALVFDNDNGYYSINQAAVILGQLLRGPYTRQRVYYLIHKGIIPAKKIAGAWVIEEVTLEALYDYERDVKGQGPGWEVSSATSA